MKLLIGIVVGIIVLGIIILINYVAGKKDFIDKTRDRHNY